MAQVHTVRSWAALLGPGSGVIWVNSPLFQTHPPGLIALSPHHSALRGAQP